MPPVMRAVTSSHINRTGYDAETQEFHVQWTDGKTSVYEGVPAGVADSVQNSWSVGKALRESIKGAYKHRYRE